MVTETEYQPFLPPGFKGRPVTPVDALKRGKAVLEVEGRWRKGDWFTNAHPDVDPEDAFCNNWMVCAEGALLMVTIGAFRETPDCPWTYQIPLELVDLTEADVEARLYRESLAFLQRAGKERYPSYYQLWESAFAGIAPEEGPAANQFNDRACKDRTDAIGWFDDAIALAEKASA